MTILLNLNFRAGAAGDQAVMLDAAVFFEIEHGAPQIFAEIEVERRRDDLVVLAWVLEHLDSPEKAFREIYRVLKPGSSVIFLTPNTWNYNVWIIRMIPNRFHDFFTRKLYNRQEHDTYRVRYKINSANKIDRILLPLGFKKTQLIFNGDPSYISFNTPLFKFACLLENLLDWKWLNLAKVHLIGIYQKG